MCVPCSLRDDSKAERVNVKFNCVYTIFIYCAGEKIASLPLIERKEIMNQLDFKSERIVNVQWIEEVEVPYFYLVEERDLEGIVLKQKNSKYRINKRSD
ncbi:hypothetical protein [Cerasibacillus sp.]|uniref:ATP-dependent DNA ligase n=1 Tax=Cerasibacillus sp. TaxID=2498711 RepID=UPI0039C8A7E9